MADDPNANNKHVILMIVSHIKLDFVSFYLYKNLYFRLIQVHFKVQINMVLNITGNVYIG